MDLEQIILNMITHSGEARSIAMEAIKHARKGDIQQGKIYMDKAEEKLGLAHQMQTELIQKESQGKKVEISLLLVHAQDHLMNALTIKDLALEFIEMYQKITE